MLEQLAQPGMCKVLGSIPSTEKIKRELAEGGGEIQASHCWMQPLK